MAKKKFTDLPQANLPLQGPEIIALVQDGESVQATVNDLPSDGGGAVDSVNGDTGEVVVDLQSVLDEGAESVLDAGTITRVGIALNNDDQERIVEITEDGPSLKYINGADQLEVTVGSGGIGIGGSIGGVSQSINITSTGIELVTPAIAASDDSAKIATTAHVKDVVIGVQDLFVSAAAMWPRTTNGCAALAKTEMATSLFNIQSLDFDQTTQEFAQFQIVLPRKWNNGTVTAVVYWTAASGSGDVQWGISGGAYSNDDALTVALGTAQTVDDTLIATNDLHISSATAAITLAGTPTDADFLAFQISRNPGSDTLSGDAKLLGVSIRITTDAALDA